MKINNVMPQTAQNNTQKAAANVGFKGNIANKVTNFLKLERAGNMAKPLFVTNACAFLLSGRLFTSRDKDEVRETAVRDVPTIFIAVFGVGAVESKLAKYLNKKGMPICEKAGKNLNLVSYDQLRDWYVFDNKLHNGFDAFMQRLSDCGGNLKKIFSTLGKESKEKIAQFSENNKEFLDELNKNKSLKDDFMKAFSAKDNKALGQAKWFKTAPTIAGFIVTLGVVGLAIPKLNIALTEHIQKKRERNAAKNENNIK